MAQTAFAFDLPSPPAAAPLDGVTPSGAHASAPDSFSLGYEIGREHARYGVVPPAEHLLPGHPVRQGWALAQPGFAGRTRHADATVRRWLQMRLHAWQQGRAFDNLQLTPHYLRQLQVTRCPVTRQPIVGRGEGHLVRLDPRAGDRAGNLAMLGQIAALAHSRLCEAAAAAGLPLWLQAQHEAAHARQAADGLNQGLSATEWQRLAMLVSMVMPLSADTISRLPMTVLPPNRVMLANPLQALQALTTLQLAQADWGQRMTRLVEALPNAALRRSFHLWLHCLLPRAWDGGRPVGDAQWRERLEDAWQDARVQARWQRLASELTPQQVDALLRHAERLGVPRLHVQRHDERLHADVPAATPPRRAGRGVACRSTAASAVPLH